MEYDEWAEKSEGQWKERERPQAGTSWEKVSTGTVPGVQRAGSKRKRRKSKGSWTHRTGSVVSIVPK